MINPEKNPLGISRKILFFLSGLVILFTSLEIKAQDVEIYQTPGNSNLLTVRVLSISKACLLFAQRTDLYYQNQTIHSSYNFVVHGVVAGTVISNIDVSQCTPGVNYYINFQLRNVSYGFFSELVCDYSQYLTKSYLKASYGPYLTQPSFTAQWNQNRGSISFDADFYKYRSGPYFYEDMWVNDMIVEYSVDGSSSFTELCRIKSSKQTGNRGQQYRNYNFEPKNGNQFEARKRTTSSETWVKITGVNTEQLSDYSNTENFTSRIHWQIPTSLTGKNITLRYRNAADIGYDLDAIYNPSYSESRKIPTGTYSLSGTVVTALPSITTSAAWQDNGSVKYTVGNPNGIPLTVKYSIYVNGTLLAPDDKYFSSLINYFNYSNRELDTIKRYETRAAYSPNPNFAGTPDYNIKSNEQVVKAYVLPGILNVSFNGCTQLNTVKFSVPSFADPSLCETGNFELISADDSTFTMGVRNLGFKTYVSGQQDYTFDDPDDHGINNVKTFYYKLRRVPPVPAWGWSVHTRRGKIDYNTKHVKIKTILTTINQDATPTVTIRWDYTGEGVWCNGSSISIYRDGGGSGSIKLAEITQKTTQEFTDNSTFATCTPYTYRLEIGSPAHGTSILESATVTLPLDVAKTPELKYFKSSKGFYNDRVELEWTLEKGTLSRFLVKRKLYEESGDKFVTIADIATTSSKLYKYIDNQAVPSVYYSYLIVAISDCNGTPTEKELLSDIGFRMPTASVSGRVVYTGDVPVEGCNLIIEGADQMKNRAVTLGNGLLKIADKENLLNTAGFTIQSWLKLRTGNNGIIFDKGDQFRLLQSGTGLQLKVGTVTRDITYTLIDNKYFHLSVVQRSSSTYEVYIDSKLVCTLGGYAAPVKNTDQLIIGSGITGFMDELRIWQKALTQYDIDGNYDRYISGKEDGLTAYYRLDEAVNEYFFDMSSAGSLYNENHGTINGSCPRTFYDIPSSEQLSLKGKTDKNGNYLVAGIPYFADGTSYNFTPQLGTHEFNPKQKPLFLSDRSAVQNNVDFTDVSSFRYEGIVTYEGGNYPVEGVTFYIDNRQVIDSKGNPISTNVKGEYKLKVPIGIHTVEARKYGHSFLRDTSLNFQSDQLSGCNFKDVTRIKLIGRIVGGEVESKKPLLVGESVNNIGVATIILTSSKAEYSMRTSQLTETIDHDDGTLSKHTPANNDYTIESKKITIHTSPETGEFVAFVYPEEYNLEIRTKAVDILNGMTGAVNLKNSIYKLYEVRT